ncbi:hypothetical protein K9L97_03170 [Candidatus Woesearchaeota archaeon]|nr:hypothetical protein [Candidatus Woesearchaeota archaeon]
MKDAYEKLDKKLKIRTMRKIVKETYTKQVSEEGTPLEHLVYGDKLLEKYRKEKEPEKLWDAATHYMTILAPQKLYAPEKIPKVLREQSEKEKYALSQESAKEKAITRMYRAAETLLKTKVTDFTVISEISTMMKFIKEQYKGETK